MVAQGTAYRRQGLDRRVGRKWYTTSKALTLGSAMHITASAFINDDESSLHHNHKVWLERLAMHAPTSQDLYNCTGKACPQQAPVLNEVTAMPTPTSSGRSWAARWASR